MQADRELDKILYPGTFDPPHLGHRDLVLALVKRFPSTPVEVLLSYAPVSAGGLAKKPSASFQDRCAMLRQTLKHEMERGQITLNLVEAEIEPPVFSVKTLQLLQQGWPAGLKVGFVIGQDQVRVFDRWFEPNVILDLVSLVVVSRSQGEVREVRGEAEAMLQRLKLVVVAKAEGVWTLKNGCKLFFISDFAAPQSSTLIRKELRAGQKIPDGFLDAQVLQYIKAHNLYQ